jgi:alpha/beta superfamily hydrolase
MTATAAISAAPSVVSSARIRSVKLAGPAGRLEALLNEGAHNAPYAALVCHPHPKGGGTMHNKVVYHAMKVLNDPERGFGFPVLRFNFRGTGLSQGEHDGVAEVDDVLTAAAWLVNEYNLPLIVTGFSFGAAMASAACCETKLNIRAIIALGLPTHAAGRDYQCRSLAGCTIPKLFLSGNRDQFAPPAQLQQVVASAAKPRQLVFINDADHFFSGRLEEMQSSFATWLREQTQ